MRTIAREACVWLEKSGGSRAQAALQGGVRRLLLPAGDAAEDKVGGAQMMVRLCAHDHQICMTQGGLRVQHERPAASLLVLLTSPQDPLRSETTSTSGPSHDGRAPAACLRERHVAFWRMLARLLGWADFSRAFASALVAAARQGEADLAQAAVAAESLAALLAHRHSSADDDDECQALCEHLLRALLLGSGDCVAGLALRALALHFDAPSPRGPAPAPWLLLLCEDCLAPQGRGRGGGRIGTGVLGLCRSTSLDLARIVAKAVAACHSSSAVDDWLHRLARRLGAPSDQPDMADSLFDSPSLLVQHKAAQLLVALLPRLPCEVASVLHQLAATAAHATHPAGPEAADAQDGAGVPHESLCAGRRARSGLVCVLQEAVETGRLAGVQPASLLLPSLVSSALSLAADPDAPLSARVYAARVMAAVPARVPDARVLSALVDCAASQVWVLLRAFLPARGGCRAAAAAAASTTCCCMLLHAAAPVTRACACVCRL